MKNQTARTLLRRSRTVVLLAIVAVTAGVVGAAVADTTGVSANTITKVKVARDSAFTEFACIQGEWTDVPGVARTIRVPSGQSGLILARFNGEVFGGGSNQKDYRFLVGGVETEPNAFGGGRWENGPVSLERSRGPVGPGDYEVKLQTLVPASVPPGSAPCGALAWHFTVERGQVSG